MSDEGKYTLDVHTGGPEDCKTHDWTISRYSMPVFYEKDCDLSLDEVRKFVDTLNKVGHCNDDWFQNEEDN